MVAAEAKAKAKAKAKAADGKKKKKRTEAEMEAEMEAAAAAEKEEEEAASAALSAALAAALSDGQKEGQEGQEGQEGGQEGGEGGEGTGGLDVNEKMDNVASHWNTGKLPIYIPLNNLLTPLNTFLTSRPTGTQVNCYLYTSKQPINIFKYLSNVASHWNTDSTTGVEKTVRGDGVSIVWDREKGIRATTHAEGTSNRLFRGVHK